MPQPLRRWCETAAAILLAVPAAVVCPDLNADCAATVPAPGLSRFYSESWGIDLRNTRFQPASRTSISRTTAPRLALKWVYGLASGAPRSYPLVTEDTIFIGDGDRGVVALERSTGCTRWAFRDAGPIGSAVLHETRGEAVSLFVTSRSGGVYALNAANGELLWHQRPPGDNPLPLLSGTPLVHDGLMFVPLSSAEVGLASNPFYGCCTTSGGMAALDTATGATRWHLRTIADRPVVTGRHFWFVEEHAPSGAPVWGAPMLDMDRDVLFFGSGQNYSRPATDTSDAIFAVSAADGGRRWIRQFTADDAYNTSCDLSEGHPNCPKPMGPDLDFGAPPVLARLPDGRELLIAGQKSGDVYAVEPDDGRVVWHQHLGRGGALGGVHWGMAVDEARGLLFVPISDIDAGHLTLEGVPEPGLFALDLATGARRWSHLRSPRCADRVCSAGLSAAIIAAPGVVVTGSLDGFLEVLDADDGSLLWSHDSWREYPDTVNGVDAAGGSFDAHGPMLADDLLIVSSGYGSFFQRQGNALLVFAVAEEVTP